MINKNKKGLKNKKNVKKNIYDEAINNGNLEFQKKNYTNAKYWYYLALDGNEEQKMFATLGLIKVYFNIGNMKMVRNILNNINNKDFKIYFGDLELYEFNFDKALECFTSIPTNPDILLKKALVFTQKGEYKEAIRLYQFLTYTNNNKVIKYVSLIRYIGLLIYIKDYERAYSIYSKLDFEEAASMENYITKNLLYLGYIIKNALGIECDNKLYLNRVLKDKGHSVLKEHIEYRHYESQNNKEKSYFVKDMDINLLLKDAKKNINILNGYIDSSRVIYKYVNEDFSGIVDGERVNGICCMTNLNTKNIINIYPFLPSDDFDCEGYTRDKSLNLKRKEGRKELL